MAEHPLACTRSGFYFQHWAKRKEIKAKSIVTIHSVFITREEEWVRDLNPQLIPMSLPLFSYCLMKLKHIYAHVNVNYK